MGNAPKINRWQALRKVEYSIPISDQNPILQAPALGPFRVVNRGDRKLLFLRSFKHFPLFSFKLGMASFYCAREHLQNDEGEHLFIIEPRLFGPYLDTVLLLYFLVIVGILLVFWPFRQTIGLIIYAAIGLWLVRFFFLKSKSYFLLYWDTCF